MRSKLLWAAVTTALAVLVLLPLGWLIVRSFQTEAGLSFANYAAIGDQKSFRTATVNSLVFGVAASLIGLVLGAPMAWAVSRTNMPLRGLVRAGVLGAFVTPGFVLAVAWILLAGPNAGLLNKLWIALTGAEKGVLDVYTMAGLVLVSVASTFPLAFILVYNTLELMSSDVEEAARVLGAGTARVTWTVTLPLALPAIVASVILMFLETIILYGVPAMIGVPARIYVLTTQLFSLFEWPPRIGLAAALSLPLLLVTAVLLALQRRLLARRSFATNRGKGGRRRPLDLGSFRWVALGFCGLVLLFTLVLPYAVIVWASVSKVWVRALSSASFTLDHYRFVLFEFTSGSRSIWNSLITAVIAATLGVGIAVIVAYLAERRVVRHAALLGFLAMAPLVIPGMVFAVGLSGIGRASALGLAGEGARVAVADVRAAAAAAVRDEIRAKGGEALAVPTDVSDPAAVEALVTTVLEAFGQIHVLFNSAGISMRRSVIEMSDAEWHRVLGVNLHGTFYCCRAVGRHMAERGYGRIINMASDRATFGMRDGAHYATSKGGVISLTKSLALELGRSGVTVNAINPGTTDTPMARGTLNDEEWQSRARQDPLGRFSTPEDIARLVVFLASEGGAFMTGQVVTVRMRFG